MIYTSRAVRGMGIVLTMGVLASIIAYFTRIILARSLEPADYGLFYAVFTFVLFFLFFRDLGLDQALTKYIAEYKVLQKFGELKSAIISMLLFQLISSALFSLFFFFWANWLAEHYFKTPLAEPLLKLMAIYILGSISFAFLKSFFTGFHKFKIYALIDTAKNVLILMMILIFSFFSLRIYAPVLAYVLAGPLLVIIFLPLIFKTYNLFKYPLDNFKVVTKRLFLFGMPLMVSDVGSKVIAYIDTLLLTHYRTLEEVGIYNVALPSAMALLFFGLGISAVVFPIFVELWVKKDYLKFRQGILLLHKYSLILLAPLVLALAVYANVFIGVFFGSAYLAAVVPFQILLIGVLIYTEAQVNNSIIAAIGHPKTITGIILSGAVTNALLNILLIPKFGIVGSAVATLISYIQVLLFSSYKISRYARIKIPIIIWGKTILASLLFVGIAWSIKHYTAFSMYLGMAIGLLLALSIYLLALYLLRLVDIEELRYYLKLVLQRKVEKK